MVLCDKCGKPAFRRRGGEVILAGWVLLSRDGDEIAADLCTECFHKLAELVIGWFDTKEQRHGR